MRTLTIIFAASCAVAVPMARASLAPEYQAPEVRLAGETIRFPLVLVKGYPFVQGRVGNIAGKFMLDTGLQIPMSLNDHRIPLMGGAVSGTGSFGSGQTFPIAMHPKVSDVNVADLHYEQVTRVQSQNATQLERITPDFIGWFGYQAWAGYALKLDYGKQEAIFHKGDSTPLLASERIVAQVPYTTRLRPNIPLASGSLGSTRLPVVFDTGQNGAIYIDKPTRDRLMTEGHLIAREDGTYDVKDLRVGESLTLNLSGLPLSLEPFPPAGPTGITERNLISLGYAVLRQYVTVWDFPHKTLYFIEPRS